MVDTPSARYGAREQSLGSNVNTWGETKLNQVIDLLDRGSKGYQSLTVTGDATITWTNYVATNDGQVATLVLSGTPAACTLTFPSKEWCFDVLNATTVTITLKCSGGTGIAIPASRTVRLYCNATDIFSATPNYLPNATTLTNNQDLVSYLQMSTAIATAALPATAGTVRNSAADTTAGYLSQKLTTNVSGLTTTQVAGLTSVQLSTVHAAANEQIALSASNGYVGGFLDGGVKSSQFTPSQGTAYDVDCSSAGITVNLTGMTNVMVGQEIKLNKFGNYPMFMLGTVNGISNLPITSPGDETYRYSSASWGWN